MDKQEFNNWLRNLPSPRVLLIGDLILDRYVWGDVDRISPEAPIQVLESRHREERLGGAANVAQNLVALEAEVTCLSAVGDDEGGEKLINKLNDLGVDTEGILKSENRVTPVKTRMIAAGQQVLRMDQEDTHPVRENVEGQLIETFTSALEHSDIALICDYRKGILTEELLSRILKKAENQNVPTFVDPKGRDYGRYRGTYGITPNQAETERATEIDLRTDEDYRIAASRLQEKLGCKMVVITRGSEGMSLFEGDDIEVHVPAEEIEVFDVTGAGDTVLATLGLVIGSGEPPLMAVRLANMAGGKAVEQLGTAVISRSDLMEFHGEQAPRGSDKILPLNKLIDLLQQERKGGRTVVFTNGCFDLLHRGHIQTLEFARDQGNILVVGLNSDKSVSSIKGKNRPIIPEEQRARVLASLEMVDYVVLFDEDTPERVIGEIVPDVLVKGEDWKGKQVVGQNVVETHGGRVAYAPLVQGISTTEIIEKIKQNGKDEQ